ncbi:MAG: hypothetical protein DRP30_04335 [Thermotoga sp.]|nr:MAG: hypothetical protein DRP30_04335 [Thermotoga sp.]
MMKIKVENFGREFTLGIVLIVLVSFVQFINHSFISVRTLNVILENSAVILPSAIGTTLVIIAGQIDLSVGSIFAVSAITSAQLALKGVPMFLVILWSIGIGAILGFLNGIITVTFRIPAMIVTLASMTIWRGFILWWTKGYWITDLPDGWKALGSTRILNLTLPIWIAFSLGILMIFLVRNLRIFRYVYAVGSNRKAADLIGIARWRILLFILSLNGALAGFSGLLSGSRFFLIPSNIGTGLELSVIAAAVIGGTNIMGGRGRIEGTIIGVILMTTISSSLVFLNIDSTWDSAFKGLLILLAIIFDVLRKKLRRGESMG